MRVSTCFVFVQFLGVSILYGQEPPRLDAVTLDLSIAGQDGLRIVTSDVPVLSSRSTGRLLHFSSGYGVMSSAPHSLVFNSNVRKDLELDDEQIRKLNAIRTEFSQRLNDGMKDARSGKNFDHRKWSKTYAIIEKERKMALGAVLLPHQSKRLKQISTQMKMRNQGDVNVLISKSVAEELDIDEEQKKQLRKRASELKSEMEKEIARLKDKYREKLIRELRPEQRKKLKEMVGDEFENKKATLRRKR